MSTSTERLIDFTHGLQWHDLSAEAVHQAKRRVVDTLSCALGAYSTPPARIARRLALPVSGPGSARVFGSLTPTTPDMAGFANGVMIRYLDFNDSGLGGGHDAHPSDNLGGVLAVAESVQASGADFLLALAISYEVQCQVADSAPFSERGWDQPIAGALGCALASGRLLRLMPEELHQALALAVIPNLCTCQSRKGAELSMWKGCAAANGARQGVFAALLAAHGMTGPTDPLDGTFGLWAQTIGHRCEVKPLGTPDGVFAITQSALKKFPVRNSCQTPAATALDLRVKLDPHEIETLTISTYQLAYDRTAADRELWAPRTRETADHSILIAVALTLLDGEITPQSFSRERFRDADVLALIARTRVEVDEKFTREFVQEIQNCRITTKLSNGTEHVSHLRFTPEQIIQGPSDAEIEDKFERLTCGILLPNEQRRLLDALWRLEDLDNVTRMVDLLRI